MGKKRAERAVLRQVFKDTFEMWNEIALESLASKGCTALGGKFLNNCPSCHYVSFKAKNGDNFGRTDCHEYCPMLELWPEGCGMTSASPYYKWCNHGHSPRQARLIADFAWSKI